MIKKIIGLLIFLVSLNSLAQRNNVSPFSFFGNGDSANKKTVEEIGMGQVGGAYASAYQLSFTNPASYGSLRFTTFALAGESNRLSVTDNLGSQSSSSTSFSYMALGFPLGENAGLVFGIQPNTSVGFSLIQQDIDVDDNLIEENSFNGEGGTNRVFMGFGHKIGKQFTIGLEASYVFGSIDNQIYNRRLNAPLATLNKSETDVTGGSVKAGIQFNTNVSDKLKVYSGLTVGLSNELKREGTEYLISTVNTDLPNSLQNRDTLSVKTINAITKNPVKTILSAALGEENKWYAGVEYEFSNARDLNDGLLDSDRTFSFGESNRFSLGGFYTPKYNSISSYWSRMTYRAGLSYEQTGLVVDNTEINDFGISFGVGIPMNKQLSNINLTFELGTRGEATNNLVKENYFNFRLGLSLNDKWFKKKELN